MSELMRISTAAGRLGKIRQIATLFDKTARSQGASGEDRDELRAAIAEALGAWSAPPPVAAVPRLSAPRPAPMDRATPPLEPRRLALWIAGLGAAAFHGLVCQCAIRAYDEIAAAEPEPARHMRKRTA